jgi:hypothetical protein
MTFIALFFSLLIAGTGTGAPHDTIAVDRPTLLAFVLVDPGEIDADPDGDMATVADDFAYYIGTAIPALDSLGVQVVQTLDPAVTLRNAEGMMSIFPVLGGDSLRVGYWLLGAGTTPEYLGGGVHTSDELIESARKHFGSR